MNTSEKRALTDDYETIALNKDQQMEREVAMRTAFLKAGRYLVSRGENLNSLLQKIYGRK